jgi:hypothetical protein
MIRSYPEGTHSDTRITVTASRDGDTFSFRGIITRVTENSIAATMLSNLTVDELVSLRYSAKSSETLEKHPRIRYVEADRYQFELLPNDGERCGYAGT